MSEQYCLACNFVSQYIFDNDFVLNSNQLNKLPYHCVRERFNLKSQLTQSVFKAVEEFSKEEVIHVVGIDRGLRFLSVTYDERGKTEFLRSKQILRKRRKFLEIRR